MDMKKGLIMGRTSEEISNVIDFAGNDYPTRAEILNLRCTPKGLRVLDCAQ